MVRVSPLTQLPRDCPNSAIPLTQSGKKNEIFKRTYYEEQN